MPFSSLPPHLGKEIEGNRNANDIVRMRLVLVKAKTLSLTGVHLGRCAGYET